ncbi:hypothetical protein BH09MYX1_BH09MYX1_16750 [soil metagenome]
MSTKPVRFYFDYSCAYAYLASTQIGRLEAALGERVEHAPMLLGGVFAANGTPQNLMNVLSPAKAAHNLRDMRRWAELFGVPLTIPSSHPMRTVEALRATLLTGVDRKVVLGFFRAYWELGRPISDSSVMEGVLLDAGYDPAAILPRLDTKRDELRARTDEAIADRVFGAPAFLRDGELYWGQDRLHFVARKPAAEFYGIGSTNMGQHKLEVYFDFSSPFAYLGVSQAEAVAERTGATLEWQPMLLGGLFKEIGQVGVPMASWSAAKQEHTFKDLHRWAEYWNVPFKFSSHFPVNTVKAMRCYLALDGAEKKAEFRRRAFTAAWADDKNLADDAVLRDLLGAGADAILAKTQDPAIKEELITRTKKAKDIGAFGAPTWVVDGKELFWGQDRLVLVERALRA